MENSALWKATLGLKTNDTSSIEERARERLREALRIFRERAQFVADEIAQSYPWLTVHGATHLDALWEMADIVAGEDYPLTPPEAFILGGAFLTHDLGNGLAAYPDGEKEVRASNEWKDALGALIRRREGRAPGEEDLKSPPAALAREALEEALRMLHARHARRLASVAWKDSDGRQHFLIDNSELRDYYGGAIGLVAESHWASVSELENMTPPFLSPMAWMPQSWTVDSVKVACLMRVSDAAHLDQRRAPPFLRALRSPRGLSADHWKFQSRLSKPSVHGNRLLYTGGPFAKEESAAWWLCFDALSLLDKEVRAVNELLAETNVPPRYRPNLLVRGVLGIEDVLHLAKHVTTTDWVPVDARIHVSDVSGLVRNLGGTALYGSNRRIPLRELIQNASDAIRARRILEKRSATWGEIAVRTSREEEETPWIEVEDTGVGMSDTVLLRHLLDFGTSLWSSSSVKSEHPGLASSSFKPTGKFGIGFFSVFMWGIRVQVTTRRYDEGHAKTRVLEFSQGTTGRPIFRKATASEFLRDGGTRIRVWFGDAETLQVLLRGQTLAAACASLAPALDVDIVVDEGGTKCTAIVANDWMKIPAIELLRRIVSLPFADVGDEELEDIAKRLGPVYGEEGQIIGRLAVTDTSYLLKIAVSVGGLRADASESGDKLNLDSRDFWHQSRFRGGLIVGATEVAARDVAVPFSLGTKEWAVEQMRLMEDHPDVELQAQCAAVVAGFGELPGRLKVAHQGTNWLSREQVKEKVATVRSVYVTMEEDPKEQPRQGPDTAVFEVPHYNTDNEFTGPDIFECIVRACADAWNVPFDMVARVSHRQASELSASHGIGFGAINRPGHLSRRTSKASVEPQE